MEAKQKAKSALHGRKMKTIRLSFYLILVVPAFLQFLIFYVYLNLNSILLSFQKYDWGLERYVGAGLDNFKQVIANVSQDDRMGWMIKNSFLIWGITTCFCLPFSVFVAFYIYKKMFLSEFFRFVMILPAAVSSLVFSLVFKYYVEQLIPDLWEKITGEEIFGLLADPKTSRVTLIVNTVWGALGSNLYMCLASMRSINGSLIEAAHLDGCTLAQEFIYITVPSIFTTITIWLTNQIAAIFGVSMGQLAIFGTSAPSNLYTFGYYMYVTLQGGTFATYPYLSALGLCMTAIALPLTLIARKLLEKYGPSK